MMRHLNLWFVILLLLVPVSAYSAIGIGFEVGAGSGTIEANDFSYEDYDIDTGYANISFVYASNPYADNGNYSYLLNIALEGRNFEDDFGAKLESGALVFDNTFAFNLVKEEKTNVWIGPQVRIGFMQAETVSKFYGSPLEFDGAMFGLGVCLGTNIKTSESAGVGFTLGLRSTGMAGTESWREYEDDFEGGTGEGFLNISLLFN